MPNATGFSNTTLRAAVLLAIYGAASLPTAFAQTPPVPGNAEPAVIETVTVVGSALPGTGGVCANAVGSDVAP